MSELDVKKLLASVQKKLREKHIEMVFERDRLVRANAIYEATAIEGLVENIIAWHFCPDADKHLLFIGLMFRAAEVPFSRKITILIKVLKHSYPDILQDIPRLEKDLTSVRKFRNKFAHDELNLDEEKLATMEDGIHLRSINRHGKVDDDFISTAEADKRVKFAQRLRWRVFYVLLEVQRRATGEEPNQVKVLLDAINSGGFANTQPPKAVANKPSAIQQRSPKAET